MHKLRSPYFIILAISFALTFFWFRDGHILAAAESGLPFHDIKTNYENTQYSWSAQGLGNSTGLLVAANPTFWLLSKFEGMGIPNFIIEAGVFWLLLFTAGLGIYSLTKVYFPKIENKYLLLSVLFYWFNPLALSNVWHRFLINYMFLYAFYPLAVFLFIRGIRQKKIVYAFYLSLASMVFSLTFTAITFLVLIWGTIFLFTFFDFLFAKRAERIYIIKFTAIALIAFLLSNSWWVVTIYQSYTSTNLTASVSRFFTTLGNLENLSYLSRNHGALTNLFRFVHNDLYLEPGFWQKLFRSPLMVAMEFLIVLGILIFIYKKRKVRSVLLLGLIYFLTIFLIKGNNPPFGEAFQFAFLHFFPLQFFRNPVEKFSFLHLLVVSPLFAGAVSYLNRKVVFVGSIVLLLVVWGYPYWTGELFKNDTGRYEVEIPDYYKEANEWLKSQGELARFVSLPIGPEGLIFAWSHPYRGVDPYYLLFQTPNISNNTVIPYYYDIVQNITKYQLTPNIFPFLKYINAKYVLLRRDVDFKASEVADPTSVETRLREWENQGALKEVFTKGAISIFQINDYFFWPKAYVTDNTLFTNSYDASILPEFGNNINYAVLDTNKMSDLPTFPQNSIVTPTFSCLLEEECTQTDLSDRELLDKLYYDKHLPGDPIYPFVRIKEFVETPTNRNMEARLIYKVGILGKRAGELYKLSIMGASSDLINRAEEDYKNELLAQKPGMTDYLHTSNLGWFIKNSILYQYQLLSRINTDVDDDVKNLLTEWEIFPPQKFAASPGLMVYRFDVPADGEYSFRFDQKPTSNNWFVNGEKKTVSGKEKFLKGSNEVAIPFNKDLIYSAKREEPFEISSEKRVKVETPDISTKYRVTFDYDFKRGYVVSVAFGQNIDLADKLTQSAVMRGDANEGYKHFSFDFSTSNGAEEGELIFKGNANVDIKNFTLTAFHYPNIVLVSEFSGAPILGTETTITKINNTRYDLEIKKQAAGKELLVFSEMYHPGWKAQLEDGTLVPETDHLLVNFFANGWVIERAGNYKLTLTFKDEELFNTAKKVSVLGSVISVFAIIYFARKKNEKYN